MKKKNNCSHTEKESHLESNFFTVLSPFSPRIYHKPWQWAGGMLGGTVLAYVCKNLVSSFSTAKAKIPRHCTFPQIAVCTMTLLP